MAKSEAAGVKDTAVDAGKNVVETAKSEAAQVATEAKQQARSLLETASSELRSQGSNQQQRAAGALRALAKELGGMASASPESGPLTDLAQEASRRGGEIAYWLENHEPSDLVRELGSFARRRPGLFLALCAGAGVVAGRLTRGAVAANTSLDSKEPDTSTSPALSAGYASAPTDYQAPAGYGSTTGGYAAGAAPTYGTTAGSAPYGGVETDPYQAGGAPSGGWTDNR